MRLSIPYVDVAAQHAVIKEQLLAAVGRVIDDGHFILGEDVSQFERQFAERCGVRYALGVNSGTDALILALRALGVGPEDEVITTPNSFVASTSCIRLLGAKPVFVDVGEDYNLDPRQLAAAITGRTKAILPVHLTGRACDMSAIQAVARAHGDIPIVEDCAQAVIAEHAGTRVGSFGNIGCFSLHPLKTLNACGDGGVLTTDDPDLYEKLVIMRNIGLRTRDDCVMWSGNSRLDTVQAAMLLVKLRFLDEWTERRRENAAWYRSKLADVPGIRLPAPEIPGDRAVYHTFVVQADRRDELRAHLSSAGIGTGVHYPVPIHLSTAGRELGYSAGRFPVTEAQARAIVSLPVYPELTEDKIDVVCGQIRAYYQSS
jgi:dTDP-4-amino-4,6-dideoxygalactose transaminase